MLILRRELGEQIVIGDDIVVTVCRIKGESGKRVVCLGIEAPPAVEVHRRELYDAIKGGRKEQVEE